MRAIYEQHVDHVWRTVAFLGVATSEVPDVCQEVFLTVHRKLASFEGRSSLRTWIYGITTRTVAAHRRRAYTRRERPHAEVPDSNVAPPQEDHLLAQERVRRLEDALNKLDERQREVFVLYELQEMKMGEVAAALAIPQQTAYSRLHAARKALRSIFRGGEHS
ncbi:MAG: RNA polymerase sigma factor [Myxococcota bacterium]